jgi:TPR repeat protein
MQKLSSFFMSLSKKNILILMISTVLGFFILLTGGLLWKNTNNIRIHSAEEQRKINSETNPGKVEFIYTEQEQRDILKWKQQNKSMDDLIRDAMNGDRVALYNLGGYFLLGLDFPIDVRQANSYFAESASLGFAPALHELAQMYINDESNVFLGLVYKNLTISFGHTEFTPSYHDLRNKIIKDSGKNGQRIINEIERIASHKRAIILKNQNWAENKQKNKESWSLSLINQITYEDYQYDIDYWQDVYNGNNEVFDLNEIQEKDNAYFDKLYYLYQEAIEPDQKNLEEIGFKIQKIIKTMAQDGYSESEIKLLGRQAYSQAKKVYKYVQKIENDAKEAKKTMRDAQQQLKMLEEYE